MHFTGIWFSFCCCFDFNILNEATCFSKFCFEFIELIAMMWVIQQFSTLHILFTEMSFFFFLSFHPEEKLGNYQTFSFFNIKGICEQKKSLLSYFFLFLSLNSQVSCSLISILLLMKIVKTHIGIIFLFFKYSLLLGEILIPNGILLKHWSHRRAHISSRFSLPS